MSKKNEELKVVASEPLDSIDDSTKGDESSTATSTNKVDDKKIEESDKDELKKESDDDKEKDVKTTDDKPLPEIKKDVSPSGSKKERKSVSFKNDVGATEEVPINDDDNEDDKAPPQPPRPKDPVQQVIDELKAAFPNIEEKLVTATLIASQGNPDPAFNALLYISDPSFKPEIPVHKPVAEPNVLTKKNTNELTDDELLARKLQKEFELEDRRNRRKSQERRRQQQNRLQQSQQQQQPRRSDEDFDDSPDEFEQIKETFTQGLEEARTTLNGWVSNLAKRFDGNSDQQGQQKQSENPKLFGALGGSSFNENKRKSNRFDEDPEIISNDFHDRIRLQDNDHEQTPSLPTRPKNSTSAETEANSKKQWQPLETENANSDAFLVTDSEDEDIIGTTATAPSNKK